mgnify:CR=1 FL=1
MTFYWLLTTDYLLLIAESRVPPALSEPQASRREPRIPNPESPLPNPVIVDLAHYLTLRILMDALLRPSRIHFVNARLLES